MNFVIILIGISLLVVTGALITFILRNWGDMIDEMEIEMKIVFLLILFVMCPLLVYAAIGLILRVGIFGG
jgi:hypothetical protein